MASTKIIATNSPTHKVGAIVVTDEATANRLINKGFFKAYSEEVEAAIEEQKEVKTTKKAKKEK